MPRDLPKSDEPNKNENVSNLVLRIVCQYFFLAIKNATY
ncbi:hypothetical protein VCHE16_2488 [Vibrio paracholerae HE-16]|nr:hypothetical protein VCHE48_2255 [Vibrio cholerae HE48]EKG85947.1 hypothetical protein VCHE16_2488 [Vibrio paracholerae HE-16]